MLLAWFAKLNTGALGMTRRDARGHRGAGLKTAATTYGVERAEVGVAIDEHERHKEERSLERLVDMAVSRKKD